MNLALSSSVTSALSGMRSAQSQIDASGQNIANAATSGYRRQVAVPQTTPTGGVMTTTEQAIEAGESLADDIVQQKAASYAFQANLLTLRTARQMQGSLLDAFA
jgi:flagellar basal body rod protein FlgC